MGSTYFQAQKNAHSHKEMRIFYLIIRFTFNLPVPMNFHIPFPFELQRIHHRALKAPFRLSWLP